MMIISMSFAHYKDKYRLHMTKLSKVSVTAVQAAAEIDLVTPLHVSNLIYEHTT